MQHALIAHSISRSTSQYSMQQAERRGLADLQPNRNVMKFDRPKERTENYLKLLSFDLITIGREQGLNLDNVTVDDAWVGSSTHPGIEASSTRATLFLRTDGIYFLFDKGDSTAQVIGSCVDATLSAKDIIAVEIMRHKDIPERLHHALRLPDRKRKCSASLGGVSCQKIQSTGAEFSDKVAVEMSRCDIENFDEEFSHQRMVVVLQYICKCPPRQSENEALKLRRIRFRRQKELTFDSHHEFICISIPREQALSLHKFTLAWLRLRSVDWHQMVHRIVNKAGPGFSASLEAPADVNPAECDHTETGTPIRSSNSAMELTDSTAELIPELRTFAMPEDAEDAPTPTLELSREHVHWLCAEQRVPMECQVYADWFLVYSTNSHGFSLQTLYRRSAYFMASKSFRCPCLLVIRGYKPKHRFAILMSHLPHISRYAYGIPSETRLYNLSDRWTEREMFKPNEDYQALMTGITEMFNIGVDNDGHMAISIFDGLTKVHLEPCSAFEGLEERNVFGSEDKWIEIHTMELWSFKYPQVL